MTRRPRPVARSAARLGAVQALYQMDLAGTDVGEVLAQFGEFVAVGADEPADYRLLKEIVDGAVREQANIDPTLNRTLDPTWPLTRLDATVRAILRAAAYEVMFMENVPARAVINEYVDVAHAFFGEEEPRFVNGVLDRLARRRRPHEFEASA